GIGNHQLGTTQVPENRSALRRESPIGVVDGDLRDSDRVGSIVEDRQLDAVRAEYGALDRQSLDWRRSLALKVLRRPGSDDQRQQNGEKEDGEDCGEPECSG